MRTALAEVVWPRHPERTITVSMGLAGSSAPAALSAAEWIEAADRNLYTAKKSGRNRVVMSDVCSGSTLAKAG
jgi:diguanylate cyclase